ncbi:MAG: ectonucleotide pyrophosphatase/phosphodiesterase [Hyphomonadaceae bacterium]
MNVRALLSVLIACVLAACAHAPKHGAARGPVILVSIDGFRADYLQRGITPALSALAAEGAQAAMRPSFPSVTFPNHYAMITGLRPDKNGIVANAMDDPAMPGRRFTMANRAVAADPRWWNEAEPLWVAAERQGVRTATMFWPGSDYEIRDVRPRAWRAFDQGAPSEARVDQVLAWLAAPAAERPRFLTLYLDIVDTAGHNAGPDAPALDAALRQADAAIARLVAGLRAQGLYDAANLVIVADHGMAATPAGQLIDLDALFDPKAADPIVRGPMAMLAPAPGREGEVEAAVLGRRGHMECWRKSELPARFHYGRNPRVAAIVCLADVGWLIVSRSRPDGYFRSRGAHGYDPEAPEMAALFIARGPAIRSGVRLEPFDNVDVYPLVAHLAGVRPQAHDGTLASFAAALEP